MSKLLKSLSRIKKKPSTDKSFTHLVANSKHRSIWYKMTALIGFISIFSVFYFIINDNSKSATTSKKTIIQQAQTELDFNNNLTQNEREQIQSILYIAGSASLSRVSVRGKLYKVGDAIDETTIVTAIESQYIVVRQKGRLTKWQ